MPQVVKDSGPANADERLKHNKMWKGGKMKGGDGGKKKGKKGY
jgi:hypothetical protein